MLVPQDDDFEFGRGNGDGDDGSDSAYLDLITDEERPKRKRPAISRLMSFAAGVALMNTGLLLAAYSLLLLSLVFRLAVPRVEGAIFDAFNALEMSLVRHNLGIAMGLVAAEAVLSLR